MFRMACPVFAMGAWSAVAMSGKGKPPRIIRPARPSLRAGLRRPAAPPPGQRRRRILAGAITAVAHLGLVAVLLWWHGRQAPQKVEPPEPAPLEVTLLN